MAITRKIPLRSEHIFTAYHTTKTAAYLEDFFCLVIVADFYYY
jgi:hypothetical protein